MSSTRHARATAAAALLGALACAETPPPVAPRVGQAQGLCETVRLIDPDGAPVPGAAIRYETEDAVVHGRTDRRGTWPICPPIRGANGQDFGGLVVARARGSLGRMDLGSRTGEDFYPAIHDFELGDGLVVRGRVTGVDGRPLAGASVFAHFVDPEVPAGPVDELDVDRERTRLLTGRARWETDAGGRFELTVHPSAVPEGWAARDRIALRAVAAGYQPAYIVILAAPARDVEVSIEARRAGVVRGRVSHAGRPVVGASLRLSHMMYGVDASLGWEVTDAEGAFRFDHLRPGRRYHLTIRAAGLVASDRWLEPGRAEVEVELAQAATPTVVLHAQDAYAQCLRAANVHIEVDAPSPPHVIQPLDPLQARFDGLLPGRTSLLARLGPHEIARREVLLAPGPSRVALEAAVPAEHGLLMAICGTGGIAVRVQPVERTGSGGAGRACVALPPGDYQVAIRTSEGWSAPAQATVTSGRLTTVRCRPEAPQPP